MDDLTKTLNLIEKHGTAYKATKAINQHFEDIGMDYRMPVSTIGQMLSNGKGKPGMVALVYMVLIQITEHSDGAD